MARASCTASGFGTNSVVGRGRVGTGRSGVATIGYGSVLTVGGPCVGGACGLVERPVGRIYRSGRSRQIPFAPTTAIEGRLLCDTVPARAGVATDRRRGVQDSVDSYNRSPHSLSRTPRRVGYNQPLKASVDVQTGISRPGICPLLCDTSCDSHRRERGMGRRQRSSEIAARGIRECACSGTRAQHSRRGWNLRLAVKKRSSPASENPPVNGIRWEMGGRRHSVRGHT